MDYKPEGWVLLKITGEDPHYRVFGTWRGGYADGDSWRINSGVTRVAEDDDYYYFYGSSGSKYICHKETYGDMTFYHSGVIQNYVDKSDGQITLIEQCPDVMNIDWIIE